ncbi:intermembrane phospholipid transport protein YdbH family protein [Phenylobacterium soli]|uniref:intermembrane phospholipid transport protein YdbH family protein n=1 Tax=Phenylobacterium soli TaxID=2170551 RepID=UPI001057BE4E|nr:YdbH domain-containing protein [Phenylobacterium soli]
MTDQAAQTRQGVRGVSRVLAAAVLAVVLGLVILVLALYLARRQLAREAVTDWLRARGIASETSFEEIGPGRLVGRVRIGPAVAPDLVVERAEVTYSLSGLIAGKGVQVTSVRLTRPVLRASWRAGRFSLGALDPLIAEMRKRPPTPGAPSPAVALEQGRLLLATDYGPLQASLDAAIRDGRLVSLDATTAPARLTRGHNLADLGAARLKARVEGGRLEAQLNLPFHALDADGATARDGLLTAGFQGVYPDLARPLAAQGALRAALSARAVLAGGTRTEAVQLTALAPDLAWRRDGGDRVAGGLKLAADLHGLAVSDLHLASAAGDLAGSFSLGRETRLDLVGAAEGRGAWTGLGLSTKEDSAEIAAVKRGVRAFRVSLQGLALGAGPQGLAVRLTAPARLLPDGGGEVRLTPAGAGWRLTSSGGGLPVVTADVRRASFIHSGLVAEGSAKAVLSIGPLEKANFDAAGTLRIANGVTSLTASRCADVSAAKVELGQNDVEALQTRVCPAGGALLTLGAGGWAFHGRAEGARAAVPFLQARLAQGAGRVSLADRGGALGADLQIASAEVHDTADKPRFHPVLIAGRVGLAHDLWSGGLDVKRPSKSGPVLAHAVLRHEGRSGAGGVEITTPRLAFAPGGLQPAELSPLAEPLGTAVQGEAAFTGGFRWTKDGATSSGELDVPGLDFKSPAGQVTGLSGHVRFTSLAPLIAPPGQVLKARRIDAVLPLTDLSTTFALEEKALVVTGGQAATGGGLVKVERLAIPLVADQPIQGVLDLQGVQLHDLVEASPFGDRVDLDARVSGHVPFEVQGDKVRVSGGDLHAIAPGRLSISRTALASVSAQGSVQAPAAAAQAVEFTDTFTDFAYQALENLAFDKLDAGLNTRANGRLGVLFHIVGYHDPPKPQEIRISLWDLVRKKFMGRKLPLPSGTGVDLTLDTTLNLDDLLKDYADFERLRSSPPVQR